MRQTPHTRVLQEHRARLDRLLDRRGAATLKKMYEDALAGITRRIRAQVHPADSFTAHQQRIVVAQLRQGLVMISRRMVGELGDLSQEAQREAIRGVAKTIAKLEKQYRGAEVLLPLEEAARFRGVMDKRKTSLLTMHKESVAKWGARTIEKTEREVSKGMLMGENSGQVIDRLLDPVSGPLAGSEWWHAERIVRTESAWAFNAAHRDAIEEAQEELPDLAMRWTEHVDDDGLPMDDRVGVDSLAMHGQVADVDGEFTMPPTAPDGQEVHKSLVGEEWDFPPNRPNDRAVLLPWRPGWGIPGWRWQGRRVPVH